MMEFKCKNRLNDTYFSSSKINRWKGSSCGLDGDNCRERSNKNLHKHRRHQKYQRNEKNDLNALIRMNIKK